MSKRIYESYVVVGTGEEEGGYLRLAFKQDHRWVAHHSNATTFSDLAQADHLADHYGGVVKKRTIIEEDC